MYKHILVAAEDSPPAKEAFLTAHRLAQQLGAVLQVIHAGPADDGFAKVLEGWCRPLPGGVKPPEIIAIRDGNPAQGILDALKSMRWELLVLGTNSRRVLGRAVLGSVAQEVLRQSPVPVVLVRPESA